MDMCAIIKINMEKSITSHEVATFSVGIVRKFN